MDWAKALKVAAAENDARAAREALALGADPNQNVFLGRNALTEASRKGSLECARALLEGGADPNQATTFDDPKAHLPLLLAARAGDAAMVELLLSFGARADALCAAPRVSAAMEAARLGFFDVVTALWRAGADLDLQGEEGHSARSLAFGECAAWMEAMRQALRERDGLAAQAAPGQPKPGSPRL